MTRRPRATRAGVALAVFVLFVIGFGSPALGSNITGSAGTDTTLPATDSQVTVSGRGPFADLKVTINQTKNLVNQAISLKWTGAAPTRESPGIFAANYLQVFQCWGDPDGSNPENPGPSPEKCAQGARLASYGLNSPAFPPGSFTTERIISRKDFANFDPADGVVEPKTGHLWKPFKAVNGTVVDVGYNTEFNPGVEGGSFWTNPYYNIVTTNELASTRTLASGKGAELMEVATGIENAGLGCGQTVEVLADGSKRVPKCWIVIVPRGTPKFENVGTPYEDDADNWGVMTSPLAPAQWANRIAVPLEFNPVDSSCDLSADSTRLAGTELASLAITNWEPKLCAVPGLQPFSYGTVADATARQQLVQAPTGAPGMAVVSAPVESDLLDPDSPIVYAPLTLSGIVVGFNVERNPNVEADDAAHGLTGVRFATLNLTPRLLAKLLTQSYKTAVNIKELPKYDWLEKQPDHMGDDPDFLRFNPEFKEAYIVNRRNFSGLLMPAANSDAAKYVWQYILADPEAKRWLDGTPDDWGMRVNPIYGTTAAANSQGAPFADPVPTNFPKSDPYCYQAPPIGPQQIIPAPLCGTDWLPFTESFHNGAKATRAADDGAKLVDNAFPRNSADAWKREVPQSIARTMLSLTTSPSASLFGVQAARLSRAGDDGDGRDFVAADTKGLTAAIAGMTAKNDAAVLELDPTVKVPDGYPLAVLSYAAIKPLGLPEKARADYAALIKYASEEGQSSGLQYGDLPLGYAPLPPTLRTQTATAAKTIVDLKLAAQVENGSESLSEAADSSASDSSFGSSSRSNFASSDPATISAPVLQTSSGSKSPLKRLLTPAVAVPFTRYALPLLAGVALLAGLGALEITKGPRRARGVS